MELLRNHAEKVRFAIVGVANTALDFILLFLFVFMGVDKIVANYFSTSISFIFSFFFNKSFTFKSKTGNVAKQFAIFIAITIIALWVIQPLIIWGVTTALVPTGWAEPITLFIAKVLATVASLIWNYIFYSRLVFKKAGK